MVLLSLRYMEMVERIIYFGKIGVVFFVGDLYRVTRISAFRRAARERDNTSLLKYDYFGKLLRLENVVIFKTRFFTFLTLQS